MREGATPRLILLPGMGTDARLFAPQRAAFPELEAPAWIAPRRRETLPGYARRWAETVDPTPPLFLGGVSFGGMVAVEAARFLGPRAVFLIASCASRRPIPRPFMLAERISRFCPDKLLRRLREPIVNALARREGLSLEQRELLQALARDCDLSFLRWAGRAIAEWEASPRAAGATIPVFRVHGSRDRLIRCEGGAEDVIVDGGHLINLTHSGEVNAFLRGRMSSRRGARGRAEPRFVHPRS